MSSPAPQDRREGSTANNNTERHDTPLLDGITEYLNGAAKETGMADAGGGEGTMTGSEIDNVPNENDTHGFESNVNTNHTNQHDYDTRAQNYQYNRTEDVANGEDSGTQGSNTARNNNATETEPPAAQTIQIRITSPDNETTFRIKTSTKMARVMTAYAEKAGRSKATMRFLYDGNRVNDTDTPESLEMEEGDAIEVHQEQTGGGGSTDCGVAM